MQYLMRSYLLDYLNLSHDMRKEAIFIIFVTIAFAAMVASRRIFGDWGDGIFIVLLASAGILFWILRNKK